MRLIRTLASSLLDPFRRADGRLAWLVVLAFLAINGLVLVNAWLHDPRVGYDAAGHRSYAKVLATGRLPTAVDTHEFFSPPLPYAPVAIARSVLNVDQPNAEGRVSRWWEDAALKVGQFAQVGYSLVLTLAVLAIARLMRPGDAFVAFVAMVCLGMMPVYYRSFAMVRGEPLLVALAMVGLYLTLRTFAFDRPTLGRAALVGLTLGGACASRQWAFFLLPGLALVGLWRLIVDAPMRGQTLRAGLTTMFVAALVGSPFYLFLHVKYGSVKTFNRTANSLHARDELIRADPDTASAATAPAEEADEKPQPKPIEAISLSEGVRRVVTHPVRDRLADQRTLLFYADTWGDYWQYYLLYGRDKRGRFVPPARLEGAVDDRAYRTNYPAMAAYLGRVCAVSIVPTLTLLAGLGAAVAMIWHWPRSLRNARESVVPTLGVLMLSTLAGYVWFVTSYLGDRGDTVKATYLLQFFPLVALATAAFLAHVRDRRPRIAWAIVTLLLIVLAHNAPTLLTHTVRPLL